MIFRFISIISLILVFVALGSCGSRKDMVYFQGDDLISDTDGNQFELRYEINDLLSIEVSGPDPEVTAPYNQTELVRQGSNQITSYENGVPATSGYLIASDSTVSLPIIGKVKLAGLERTEAMDTLRNILDDYLETPNVSIKLLNFKITVLGEVGNPGTFSIPNDRVTILEAIGIANDLKITAERKNILVVRHEGNKKTEHRIDLTSKEVFNSPVYYLKQNDVIYVEPNTRSRFDSSILKSTSGLLISATSLIVTTIILIRQL